MSTDLWVPALAALLGAAVGGISNYLVMTAQANRESVERAKMRTAERADRYATTVASVIGEVAALLHHRRERQRERQQPNGIASECPSSPSARSRPRTSTSQPPGSLFHGLLRVETLAASTGCKWVAAI
jgi:hypothetical protein